MNKYKEIKTLGKGSFGRAILVQELTTGKQFVMKQIQVSAMKPQEREEALQESKILEKLQHQNITAYKESFTDQKYLYIIMEYCNGGDLHDAIKAQKQKGQLFDENVVWDYFLQCCLAVKHIHDRRILHRDLKTQNIFISQQSGKKMMKIGDFGVSKILSSTMECARTAIGTPYYLSPELCNNQGYNNKSDIWALGCILYEMCTLNHTFEAANMKMLIVKILEGRYQQISSKYSQQLRDVITAMLQKNPKQRPSINALLSQPFLMQKIKQILPDQVLDDEFSHTVFHGKGNLLKGFQEEEKPAKQNQNPFLNNKAEESNTPREAVAAQNQPNAAPTKGFQQYPSSKPVQQQVVQQQQPIQQQQQLVQQQQPSQQQIQQIKYDAASQQIQKQVQQKQQLINQERQKAEQLVIEKAKQQQQQQQKPVNIFAKNAEPAAREQVSVVSAVPVPSANTLANKFSELNNFVQNPNQQIQPPTFQQPPPQIAFPTNIQRQPQPQNAPIGGMFSYNPPANMQYPSNIQQPSSNNQQQINHQKEVIRQLAPMSDKDKIRYQRDKDMREKREKAQQLQQQHQDKIAMQQKERKDKYAELNKKYEEQMALKRVAAAKVEENDVQQLEIQKKQKEELQKIDEVEKKRKQAEMLEIQKQVKQKQDVEREKMREFINQKKVQQKDIKIEIFDLNQNNTDKATEQSESSDFGDQPDQAMQKANDQNGQQNVAEELKKLLSDKNAKDSLCYRMESLRAFLEKELGFDNFFTLYETIQKASHDDNEDYDHAKVDKILGEERMGYMNVIVQLIIVEQDFNEAQ